MKRFVLILGIMFIALALKAQSVNGHWYGLGIVDVESGTSNNYMTELILKQKGNKITGELNYYFRDSLFSNKITGTFNSSTRKLVLYQLPVIYFNSTSTLNGIDCPMSGEFILRVSKTESVISGTLVTNAQYKYLCPVINFKFKRSDDTTALVVDKTPEPEEKPVVKVDKPKQDKPKAPKPPTVEEKKTKEFTNRGKSYLSSIEVVNKELTAELYDNGTIDGDSVSIFVNNKLLLAKTMLQHQPIKVKITMDSTTEYTEVSMFAENLGLYPPNTAILILYDGDKRYDINITSSLKESGTIRLRRKKQD